MNNQITCIQLATFFTLDFARDHLIDVHHSLETERYYRWGELSVGFNYVIH